MFGVSDETYYDAVKICVSEYGKYCGGKFSKYGNLLTTSMQKRPS
jgi:hypothetical protein